MSWIHNISSCVTIFPLTHWTELISFEFTREIFARQEQPPERKKRRQPKLLWKRWWMTVSLLHNLHSPPTTSSSRRAIMSRCSARGGGNAKFSASQCFGESIFTLSRIICPTFRVHSRDSVGKHGNKKAASGWQWVDCGEFKSMEQSLWLETIRSNEMCLNSP